MIRTHKMTDLRGITVTPGVLPAPLRHSLASAVDRIGGKMADSVRIDTTHFVCTEGRGREWERAVEMNIPVVRPEWVEGCEREGRIVGVRGYYLNADPRLRQVGQGVGSPGAAGQQSPGNSGQTSAGFKRGSQASVAGASQDRGPAAGAETAGTSPSLSQARSSRGATPIPPTPPAKDERHARSESRHNISGAASPAPEYRMPRATARESSGEDEVDGNGAERHAARQPTAKGRDLVQSPFDSSAPQAQNLALRVGTGNEKARVLSDGEGFSEVQL